MRAGIPISIPSVLLGYYFYENYPYTDFCLKIMSLFYKLGFGKNLFERTDEFCKHTQKKFTTVDFAYV